MVVVVVVAAAVVLSVVVDTVGVDVVADSVVDVAAMARSALSKALVGVDFVFSIFKLKSLVDDADSVVFSSAGDVTGLVVSASFIEVVRADICSSVPVVTCKSAGSAVCWVVSLTADFVGSTG